MRGDACLPSGPTGADLVEVPDARDVVLPVLPDVVPGVADHHRGVPEAVRVHLRSAQSGSWGARLGVDATCTNSLKNPGVGKELLQMPSNTLRSDSNTRKYRTE